MNGDDFLPVHLALIGETEKVLARVGMVVGGEFHEAPIALFGPGDGVREELPQQTTHMEVIALHGIEQHQQRCVGGDQIHKKRRRGLTQRPGERLDPGRHSW